MIKLMVNPSDATVYSVKESREFFKCWYVKPKYLVAKEDLRGIAKKLHLKYVCVDTMEEDSWFVADKDWEFIYASEGA